MDTLNEKMTALADEVRTLSETTGSKSIDTMTTDIQAANTEIAEQADLIAQIATALEGKAAGGGEEGAVELALATVTVGVNAPTLQTPRYTYTDENMALQVALIENGSFQVPINTIITIEYWTGSAIISGSCSLIFNTSHATVGFVAAYKITGDCELIYG